MSTRARSSARIVLNDGMVFVSSRALTRDLTGQSISELIDQQLKNIEGESDRDISGKRRNPKPGEIARIQKIQQDMGQLADAIAANPELLNPDPTSELPDKTVAVNA